MTGPIPAATLKACPDCARFVMESDGQPHGCYSHEYLAGLILGLAPEPHYAHVGDYVKAMMLQDGRSDDYVRGYHDATTLTLTDRWKRDEAQAHHQLRSELMRELNSIRLAHAANVRAHRKAIEARAYAKGYRAARRKYDTKSERLDN